MKLWKSVRERPNGVWTNEIRLKSVGALRQGKVNKLLKLLKEEIHETIL